MSGELEAADAYCRFLVHRHYENFLIVSGLPARSALRRDLMRTYAYCRTTDDLGDESGACARARLERWRDEVVALFERKPVVHPVLLALRDTVDRMQLPREPFLALIQANLQDQDVSSYADWPALRAYCMLSAAPVGRMVLGVFGLSGAQMESLSDDVCIGLQLANFAQDVSWDAAKGRLYLLQPELRAGGTALAVRAHCDRARTLLASGRALEALAPEPLRRQLALYRLGGLAIVAAIERAGYRTDLRRPRVSAFAKSLLLLRTLLPSKRGERHVRELETA